MMIYQILFLLQFSDTKNAESLLFKYVESNKVYEKLMFLCFARLARMTNLLVESQKIFQLIQKEERLKEVSLYLTKEEIEFSSSVIQLKPKKSNSASEQRWKELKDLGAISSTMDELMKMSALENQKAKALHIFETVEANSHISDPKQKVNLNFNFVFTGNPGTGKTTVARLFGKLLYEIGVRKKDTFTEAIGSNILSDGSKEFEKLINNTIGGVLFIDEAYQLEPFSNSEGKSCVNLLMTTLDKQADNLTVILAGYKDDIDQKIINFNPGLGRRFNEYLEFEDFDENQMKLIFESIAKEKNLKLEKNVSTVASRKLFKQSKIKGFGNAGAVKILFDKVYQKTAKRKDSTISMLDLLGERPDPKTNKKLAKLMDELNSVIGWRSVKADLHKLILSSLKNYDLEMKGESPNSFILHAQFLGNPGTGKTSCAKLYGEILQCLNLLSDGRLMQTKPSDYIGDAVGVSTTKTKSILENAKGKVLLIDETYNLNNSIYGADVCDAIVEVVTGLPGEDLAMILVGYEHEMIKLFESKNKGLPRRFNTKYYFEDFTDEELYQILVGMCKKRNFKINYECNIEIISHVTQKRSMIGYGNAGELTNILDQISKNLQSKNTSNVTLEDLDFFKKKPDSSSEKRYNNSNLEEVISDWKTSIEVGKRDNELEVIQEIKEMMCATFVGPTGKKISIHVLRYWKNNWGSYLRF
jgi:AAA+ superfamily predicted ATPase